MHRTIPRVIACICLAALAVGCTKSANPPKPQDRVYLSSDPVIPLTGSPQAKTIATLDRLNLRRGQELTLVSGREATVFGLRFVVDEKKPEEIFPMLVLVVPSLPKDMKSMTDQEIAIMERDLDQICLDYGQGLVDATRVIFPDKQVNYFTGRFRDKHLPDDGFQLVQRYGAVFLADDPTCDSRLGDDKVAA